MATEHRDIIIVGAGISGIGAAVHLTKACPGKTYMVLEGRSAMGGTWDLFRYPGIRSDSDMYTFGYSFKPWREGKAIADGQSILRYLHETAAEYGVDAHIRYRHAVTRASWSSEDSTWTVEATRGDTGESVRYTCSFLVMCSGYYSYKGGYEPHFEGREQFRGPIVHPQQWPEGLDYRGKRVVVIGSGATAVTLVPSMARDAAHVTMLQRSPSYVVSRPSSDAVARVLQRVLPAGWAYAVVRWKNILLHRWLYRRARRYPAAARKRLIGWVRDALGPDYDVDTHFAPAYDPWDQRVCAVPDGDMFKAIREGRASVVTGRIERFTETGILLESGKELAADLIVTATGFNLVTPGEMQFEVDGVPLDFSTAWTYRGMMFSDVPNLVYTMGYVNASWTLRVDLTSEFLCRLLNHMDATGTRRVTPRLREADHGMVPRPWLESFTPGYVQRYVDRLPRQGDREPWINTSDYVRDRVTIRTAPLEDGVLQFEGGVAARVASRRSA